jgi:hypothetical protein
MDSSRRLAYLEETLELWYEHLGEAEKALPMAFGFKEKTAIKQNIRVEILPAIRMYEKEYWSILAKDAPDCKVDEVAASHAIVKVVQEVELIQRQPNQYPDDLMRKLQEILDKLNEPQTPAAARLIAALPLIPGILSCEIELDTEISLKRVFGGIKKILKKNSTARIPSSTHTTQIDPGSPQLITPQASVVPSQLYQEIEKPGALICVKTSRPRDTIYLIANEIIKDHTPKDYKAVRVNFQWANNDLTNSDKLLQWFCDQITSELPLQNTLAESWQGETSSNMKCTNYFEKYLLPKIPTALVLVLYNVELIIEHQAIADSFFALLKAWRNKAANDNSWEKVRLVIVHSQDINPPFSVGVVIKSS